MTSISLNCLYWNNNRQVQEIHKSVMDHFGIPVNYYNLDGMNHWQWIEEVLKSDPSDIIGFIDVDCVPTNEHIVNKSIEYVTKNNTFIGLAQSANHINNGIRISAVPTFYFISKEFWTAIGSPTYSPTSLGDIGEYVCYLAEKFGYNYKALYPLRYEENSHEGEWKLGNYGKFGIGTYYSGGIYHLFQSRFSKYDQIFKKRCHEIIQGNFNPMNLKYDCVEI